MLGWVLFGVLLGTVGVAFLAVLTVRLYRQVRRLGRDVSAAGARIAAINSEMKNAAPRR
jgi:uncharacterized membrane protein